MFLRIVAGVLVGLLALTPSPTLAQSDDQLPPIAIATLEATVTTPAVVTLDGSGSFDPSSGGRIVRYRWEILTEAYQWLEINQANPQTPVATVELPSENLIERLGYSIEFRLTVTDNGRPAASDSETVTLRINQAPVADIEISAKLYDSNEEPGIDDNRNGMVDENEERYTIEGVASRPGVGDNAANEWDVRAATLLVIDGSGSYDPDGELTDGSFTWELLRFSGASSVARSLPIGIQGGSLVGQQMLSTDEDPNTPASTGTETVARLPFVRGVGNESFAVWYRLTVTDVDGASAREIVRIVFDDFHDGPEAEILRPESDPDATSDDDRYAGVLDAGEDRYVISTEAARKGLRLIAEGEGDGESRTDVLRHTWVGVGVEPSEDNAPGFRSEAEFTAPDGTAEGDSFTVTVEVVDPDGLRAMASIELVVADTSAPTVTVPDDIDTPDGIDGGFPVANPPTGFVNLRGIAFDPDDDQLTYLWEQVRNEDGDPLRDTFRGTRLRLFGSTTPNASFKLPEVSKGSSETVYVQFTVTDRWGVVAADVVQITMRDGVDDLRALPGVDQRVLPGSLVSLASIFRYGLVSASALDDISHRWVYRGIETEPQMELRPPITPREEAQGFVAGEWLPNPDGTYDPAAGGRLKNGNDPFAYFDAPVFYDFDWVKLVFELTARYLDDEKTATVTVNILTESVLKYYSGSIDGPDFCTNRSLGGPLTHPFDSDDDGVADVCALQETRRAVVARQLALKQLADLNQDIFTEALFGIPDDPDTGDVDESTAGTCSSAPTDLGDTDRQMNNDACGRYARDDDEDHSVTPLPPLVDAASARKFYSGVINGSIFCSNHSLGSPTTYPFDSDGDGVADVCALPYTRREAVARHNALRAAFEHHSQYPAALAAACAALGSLDFGDDPDALAEDSCNPAPTDFGSPLPVPSG